MNAPLQIPLQEHDPTQDPNFPWPPEDLVAEDGIPLETHWHRLEIGLLVDLVRYAWRDRMDYYANGNMFIYFGREQSRKRDFRGPDFFLVKDVTSHYLRQYWAVWNEEGRYPNLIVELMSTSTRQEDLTTKKRIYEQTFRTPEYFAYDPDTQELLGWKLVNSHYEVIQPSERGWLWSAELGLWLGTWQGVYHRYDMTWLRLYNEKGELIPTPEEAAIQQAQSAEMRAQAEAARVAALEDELARLREQLQAKSKEA